MLFRSHIPEHLRVTTWTVERDLEIEARMVEKVKAARVYYAEVVAEFDRTHRSPEELKSLLRLQAEARLAEAMKAAA